jgi:hypothetical protein
MSSSCFGFRIKFAVLFATALFLEVNKAEFYCSYYRGPPIPDEISIFFYDTGAGTLDLY